MAVAKPKTIDDVLVEAKANRQSTQQCLAFEHGFDTQRIKAIFDVSYSSLAKTLQRGAWEVRSDKQKAQARRGAKAILAWLGRAVDDADHVEY